MYKGLLGFSQLYVVFNFISTSETAVLIIASLSVPIVDFKKLGVRPAKSGIATAGVAPKTGWVCAAIAVLNSVW